MMILYHFPLCPLSRFIRLILNEKEFDYELHLENYWLRSKELAKLNPAVEVPVLIDNDQIINDVLAIYEYLDEAYGQKSFFADGAKARSDVRRLVNWFNIKLYNEGTRYILHEKVIQFYLSGSYPNTEIMRKAKNNINHHLKYIQYLLGKNAFLVSNHITYADLAAASQISCLDYLDHIYWNDFPEIKEWYAVIKSRPSFRPLLNDRISGFSPPLHYNDLDF